MPHAIVILDIAINLFFCYCVSQLQKTEHKSENSSNECKSPCFSGLLQAGRLWKGYLWVLNMRLHPTLNYWQQLAHHSTSSVLYQNRLYIQEAAEKWKQHMRASKGKVIGKNTTDMKENRWKEREGNQERHYDNISIKTVPLESQTMCGVDSKQLHLSLIFNHSKRDA